MSEEAEGVTTPEETAVAETVTDTESQATDAPSGGSDADASAQVETAEATTAQEGDKPKTGAEKRIDRLVWEREEAKREAERLRAQLEQPQGDAPRESDFESYDDFVTAKAIHAMEAKQREQQQAALQQHEQQLRVQRQQQFQAQVQDAQSRYDDFNQVAFNPSVPITPEIADVLATSDKGADVAYYLGKHPEVAAQLASLDPLHAAIEVGKLSATLQLPTPKTVTEAPEPVKPIGGGGDSGNVDPSKMTTEEFIAWRNQQLQP